MSISLFPDGEHTNSSNWVDIDRDSTIWDHFITSKAKKILDRDDLNISILWSNKDEQKGYALGSIIVSKDDNKFIIPIIIRDFKLAPLDVIITQTRAVQFDPDIVDDLLFSGDIASGVIDRNKINETSGSLSGHPQDILNDPYGSGWQNNTVIVSKLASPDMDLRQSWASLALNKFAYHSLGNSVRDVSIIDSILDSIDKESQVRMARSLSDKRVYEKFANDNNKAPLIKLPEISVEKRQDNMNQESEVDDYIQSPIVVAKQGPGAYVVLSSSPRAFAPEIGLLDGENIRALVSDVFKDQDQVDQVLRYMENSGEKGIVLKDRPEHVSVTDIDDKGSLSSLEGPGIYEVFDSIGRSHVGVLYTKYIDLADLKEHKAKILLTKEGGGAQQGTPKGKKKDISLDVYNSDFIDMKDIPSLGDYGYFYYGASLVGPMVIQSISKEGGLISFTVATDSGKIFIINLNTYESSIGKLNKNKIFLPDKMKWANIRRVIKFGNTKPVTQKTASVTYDNWGYNLNGFDWLPSEFRVAIDEPIAKFALAYSGVPAKKINDILNRSKLKRKPVYLKGTKPPRREEKRASIGVSFDAFDVVGFNPAKYDLTKIASEFEKIDTVDKVLGLNFINPSNVTKFLASLPAYESIKEELVRLLVVARIGLTEVKEEFIKQALEAITEVTKGLEKLKFKMGL